MLCNGTPWAPFLENNSTFWDVVFTFVSLFIGVMAIVFGVKKISNVIKEKKAEAEVAASFGFYINFLAYITQLELFMKEAQLKVVFQLLINPNVRKQEFGNTVISDEEEAAIAPTFSTFCTNFLTFLSSSENNVPPNKKWSDWHKKQQRLIIFLNKCVMINKVYWYTSEDRVPIYHSELQSIQDDCTNLKKLIEEKLDKETPSA